MNLPIRIYTSDGLFTASLVGAPDIYAAAATREGAITELRLAVRQRVDNGELASLDLDDWLDLAGKYRDDPTLDEICQDAYRARDADIKS